jgi:MurNAc alpha-1-phosphate uridylyltransferase
MHAMILAAGRGERMRHLTRNLPKPLIPIAGKALIVHQIERLRDAGFANLVINLAYRGEQIRAHLGTGGNFGVSIKYSEEPGGALDTGGGVARALDLLGPEPFAVVNCDVWTDFDFSTLAAPAGQAHLILVPNPEHNPDGDFCLSNGKIVTDSSPKLTFAGIGVYRADLFDGEGSARFALAPLLKEAAKRNMVSAELFRGGWLDIGTPDRLNKAKRYAAARHKGRKPV